MALLSTIFAIIAFYQSPSLKTTRLQRELHVARVGGVHEQDLDRAASNFLAKNIRGSRILTKKTAKRTTGAEGAAESMEREA